MVCFQGFLGSCQALGDGMGLGGDLGPTVGGSARAVDLNSFPTWWEWVG